MRVYFKRITLFISICLTTLGLFFLQTIYYFPPSHAKDSFDFKVRLDSSRNGTSEKRPKPNTIVKHTKSHVKNIHTVPLQRPPSKPLSHEELRWPYNDEDYDKVDEKFDDVDFNTYLSNRKLTNKKIIALNKLPLHEIIASSECRNWTVLGSFWKKRYK